jgi:hypothetical protein
VSNNRKKNHGPAAPPPAANPEPCQALSVSTLVRIILLQTMNDINIRFDTLYSWVVCCVTAEDCMDSFDCWVRTAPHLAAEFRDDSARRERGLRLLVEEALVPLVERTACVIAGNGPDRWVILRVERSPELLEAEAEVLADYRFGLAAAQRAMDAGALRDDEVRLRAAAALRFAKDPIIRRLLTDAVLEEVRRAGGTPAHAGCHAG